MSLSPRFPLFSIICALVFISSCKTTKTVVEKEEPLYPLTESIGSVIAKIPNYRTSITSAKGKGRAIVSEPGNSDRISISFETDSVLSLLTMKNRVGIEGGKMLVDKDSILIYNKIDKYAQKVSIQDGRLTNLNELASVNFLDLMNYKVYESDIEVAMQNDTEYVLGFFNKGVVRINKKDGTVSKVQQAWSSGLPYSQIEYESYAEVEGYKLPRKITILSRDGNSRVTLQILQLDINPSKLNIELIIPDNIPLERL